jgi:hypothetical protein
MQNTVMVSAVCVEKYGKPNPRLDLVSRPCKCLWRETKPSAWFLSAQCLIKRALHPGKKIHFIHFCYFYVTFFFLSSLF